MRVVVFVLRPHAVPHQFGTELEVVLDHADRGDDVHVILCNSTNHLCDSNISNYIPEVCLGHFSFIKTFSNERIN